MKSFLEVLEKENTFALCEVEMISTEESAKKANEPKQVKMTYVPLDKFNMIGNVTEGDVFAVLHNAGRVFKVLEKDLEATASRRVIKKREKMTV